MRTLHSYLTKQILATVFMTVVVFGFILLLGNVLKEVLALIIMGQATVGIVVTSLVLLVPFVLVFALPMGMLTATLLVFGRFSADQELTAVRSSGVSLLALITPALLLSVALSGVAALINMDIAPRCRVAYKRLLLTYGVERAATLIVENRFMDEFPGYVFYVGKRNDTNLQDVLIYKLDADDKPQEWFNAPRAEFSADLDKRQVRLRLFDLRHGDLKNWMVSAADEYTLELEYRLADTEQLRIPLSDMTFHQLREKLHEMEALADEAPPPGQGGDPDARLVTREDLTMPIRVQIHRQVAFAFASIGFTLIGIPLGIRAHRRETSAGVALALVLVLIYYAFIIVAQSFQDRADVAPHLILWAPNFLFQTIGALLLWRANRGI